MVPFADLLFWAEKAVNGRTLADAVGCVPIWPFPTMTKVPLLGIPLIVTNRNAGPGWNKFGNGGNWAVCKVIVLFEAL